MHLDFDEGGVPTRATRRFIRRMSEELDIEVYAFVDCDPYGICNIYRMLKAGSGNAAHVNHVFCVPMDAFVGTLNARFQQREPNDIGRVERVMQFAQHDGCLTQRLLASFGEKRQACGHCCRCLGVAPAVLVAVDRVSFSAKDEARVRDLISEGH